MTCAGLPRKLHWLSLQPSTIGTTSLYLSIHRPQGRPQTAASGDLTDPGLAGSGYLATRLVLSRYKYVGTQMPSSPDGENP